METAHTDKNFEQKLNHLTDNLTKMSNIVEKQIEIAVNVIKSKDSSDAQTTQNLDEQVDEVERDVRDLSFEIMTLHRPVASDLRLVFTALKVSKELERMGDHSRNLAKRAISISYSFDEDLTDQMHNLGKGVQKMVNQTLESFFNKDKENRFLEFYFENPKNIDEKKIDDNDKKTDLYRNIYRDIDTINKDKVDYLKYVIYAKKQFVKYLRDENSFIDYTYLWDI